MEIAKQICEGLEYAHEHQVVHRDLKPSNIWNAADDAVQIGDFGIAVALDRTRLTRSGGLAPLGTVEYMPPEQAVGGEVTPRSDLYSLGAVLYRMVTGRPPFQSPDPWAVVSQHLEVPPVPPSRRTEHCPPALEALILALMAKAPEDRPRSATAVRELLEAVDPAGEEGASGQDAGALRQIALGNFVGRVEESGRLRTLFHQSFVGSGAVALVSGEAGIGKSRLALELDTYARTRGGHVFQGRASESPGAPDYWPWIQSLRSYVSVTDAPRLRQELGLGAAAIARIIPEVVERLPDVSESVEQAEGPVQQFRLFDALATFLNRASADAPMVLMLEDLQWADEPSLLFLTYLTREIGRSRIMVVGTARDTNLGRDHPFSRAVAEMSGQPTFSRIRLEALSAEEIAASVRTTMGLDLSHDRSEAIYRQTGGSPLPRFSTPPSDCKRGHSR